MKHFLSLGYYGLKSIVHLAYSPNPSRMRHGCLLKARRKKTGTWFGVRKEASGRAELCPPGNPAQGWTWDFQMGEGREECTVQCWQRPLMVAALKLVIEFRSWHTSTTLRGSRCRVFLADQFWCLVLGIVPSSSPLSQLSSFPNGSPVAEFSPAQSAIATVWCLYLRGLTDTH